MRKFAANYLVSEDGLFLKNSIVVAEENGTAIQYIDTEGDLNEIAQLIFHNGILLAGFTFLKTNDACQFSKADSLIQAFEGQIEVSIQNLVELGKRVQVQFPEIKIPEILNKITVALASGGYIKENIPGIFLLMSVDLVGLRFTQKSRLKKIL